ncbi:MAG TPA: hypothetical protein VII94_00345 [Candidatus Saccharimonadales bacterium]
MSKKNWLVGDRVQKQEKEVFIVGAIASLNMKTEQHSARYGFPAREETVLDSAVVKWDNGVEETLDCWSLHPEDSVLERQFRATVPAIQSLIKEKLALSSRYLREAQQVADDNGIPFYSHISPLSQSYIPDSLQEKWNDVSKEVVQEETETYSEYDFCGGWQHSAVC